MASNATLRPGILSPLETLGQSIANVAPTATPAMILSQVFALSGNGTWLAYLIATVGVALVAANINQFARNSASPGSLYSYTAGVLPSFWSITSAWSLVIAYVCTATALTGGLTSYTNVLLAGLGWKPVSSVILTVISIGLAGALAYSDVSVSARLMLTLEAISIAVIFVIMGFTLYLHGFKPDHAQLTLQGVTGSSLRIGLVLAIFSSVGFESATSLGAEARNPFRSVPRAVMLSAVFSGLFFTFCSYVEVLGFRGDSQTLDHSLAPLHALALKAGLPLLGTLIDVSAIISFFSCALACITAAARILFHMGQTATYTAASEPRTERIALLTARYLSLPVLAIIPGVVLAQRGAPGFDINGWLGTTATYGFLVAYILICVAVPFYLRARGQLTVPLLVNSCIAAGVMLVAFAGSLYPVPDAPYSWLPYVFLLLVGLGVAASVMIRSRNPQLSVPSLSPEYQNRSSGL